MRTLVGISQKVKRAWLDAVLDQLTRTTDKVELRAFLDGHLRGELPGRESRAKAAGIILQVWSNIPHERVALRARALALLPRIPGQERIWLHWGMAALAYPFFRDTAEVVGRLLALQDDFTTTQVQGRMLTTWGDRATSKEAIQKLITSLVDWEVLRSTKARGHFLLSRKMTASTPDLQLWLLEALLRAAASDEIEAQQLLRLPESFPFNIKLSLSDLRAHEGFDIHRQGLDMDMVALRKLKQESPRKPGKKPRKKERYRPDIGGLFDVVIGDVTTSSNGPEAVPKRPFGAQMVECAELLQEGYYFGCIALTYAVLEAVILHAWSIELKRSPSGAGSFDRNVEDLFEQQVISDVWKTTLDRMWAEQHSYHRLRPGVENDQKQLEGTARGNLRMLNDLDRILFGLSVGV